MSSDLWANVVSGAVGGLLALGGSWFTHVLNDRRETRVRAEQRAEQREDRLRDLYVRWQEHDSEFVALAIRIIDGVEPATSATKLYDLSLAMPQTELLTLQLLETSAEARDRLDKLLDVWPPAVALRHTAQNVEVLVDLIEPWLRAQSDFIKWLAAVRFPAEAGPTSGR